MANLQRQFNRRYALSEKEGYEFPAPSTDFHGRRSERVARPARQERAIPMHRAKPVRPMESYRGSGFNRREFEGRWSIGARTPRYVQTRTRTNFPIKYAERMKAIKEAADSLKKMTVKAAGMVSKLFLMGRRGRR